MKEGPEKGLEFVLARKVDGNGPVMTAHSDGIITLNVAEANDSTRERIRELFREPYRTLLGRLRREIGHYYWNV